MILRTSRGETIDLGPSHARLAGYGGALVAYRPATKAPQPRGPLPVGSRTRYDDLPRCGAVSRFGEPCHRLPGHRDTHRSRASMAEDNRRSRIVPRP